MNCEEFELVGLDAGSGRLSIAEETAAAEHASTCAKCAALAESWDAARNELSFYKEATHAASAPARVEMRLLQELRAQKRPHERMRRAGVIAAWGLAAAAAIVVVVSWLNWHTGLHSPVVKEGNAPVSPKAPSTNGDAVLVADEDAGTFTPLPGAIPVAAEDGSIYQVRMQRASLGALGLPVNEDGASDWINVDLLVGDDGTPQGVRLHEDATQAGTIQ